MIQGQIIWFEIPVKNLDRAIVFYSEVLFIKIEKIKFLEQEYGVFNIDKSAIRGAIVAKENHNPGTGIILFFYVVDLIDSLKSVVKFGGRVVVEKTLIKQKNTEGYLTINNNLIDGNIGYYAEFIDREGNLACLYSNS